MNTRVRLVVVAVLGVIVLIAAGMAVSTSTQAPRHAPFEGAGSGKRVAFYGDSYTVGMGASDPAKRWSTIICEQRDWREFNPSVNGLGFVSNRQDFGSRDVPGAIIESKPDIVIITLGLNDNFSFDTAAANIRRQVFDDLERMNAALPDARFVVVEPFWYTDERPRSVGTIIGWVEEAAAAIDAEYIAGASRWIEGHPEWLADDGLHPNDEGYAAIARRMDAELKRLGL